MDMFKNLVYSLITKGTVALINFFILIVSSRYLGVSSRGEISIFILNITIIQIINEVYTGYSLVHFIPRFNLKKMVGYGFGFTVIFCSLSNVLICFLQKQVPGYSWMGYFISLIVILNTFNCVILLGKENLRMYNVLNFIQPLFLLLGILFFIFVLKKYTLSSYIYPLLFSFLLAFIISGFAVSMLFKKQKFIFEFQLKPIFINGSVFQGTVLMYIFVNRYSYYLLPDIAKVGLYSSASSFMEVLLVIVNGISPVLLARVANQGNSLTSINTTLALSKASFIFSSLSVLVIFLVPETYFVFVLGLGFVGIKNLMLLYAPGILMISLSGPISYYFSAIGKQKLILGCYSLGFFSTLFLAPVLVKKFSSTGAAYTAIISYFLIASSVCTCFLIINKLSIKRFFSVTTDYCNFLRLMKSHED